jgi:hypothetical protein
MFDDIVKTYKATFGHGPSLHRVINEALKRIEPDSRILNVGCSIWTLIAFSIVADSYSLPFYVWYESTESITFELEEYSFHLS